jgi:hypothetical protein
VRWALRWRSANKQNQIIAPKCAITTHCGEALRAAVAILKMKENPRLQTSLKHTVHCSIIDDKANERKSRAAHSSIRKKNLKSAVRDKLAINDNSNSTIRTRTARLAQAVH